ncbi:MAG: type II secretion system protein [Gammaproteobacteria bacterium]|nr:type II secretion system protein [Gammaproteobacteria bacterium]HXK56532.1 type II secretion system protein [Gammaproteobacteria bacterium]
MAGTGKERGFTLLEVLVATTIVGLVFGGVFSAIVVSNDLSFRTQHAFLRDAKLRFLANSVMLYSRFGEKPPRSMLPEGNRLKVEEVALKFAGEEVIQGGKLRMFTLAADDMEPLRGLVWVPRNFIGE